MADVSVEFGAKDTGLEQTLKTIQDQLVNLDKEIKSGALSFDEINKKMREAAQAEKLHASLGGTTEQIESLGLSFKESSAEIERFAQSQKEAQIKANALAEEQKKAEAITRSNRTATQIYNEEIQELQKHLSAGRISIETYSSAVAKADAKLAAATPQIKEIGNDIQVAGDKAQSASGIFDSSFQKITAAFTLGNVASAAFNKAVDIAFSAAQSVIQGFSDALDLGGRLNELSSRTGETAGKLLVLETAFKNSGLEANAVGIAINKLQNFMQDAANGGEKQSSAMQKLGISMAELSGKTPTQQMQIFADRIAAIEDPTQRAATASEVFGDKLGGKLLPLLVDFSGNLEDARAKVGSLEQVMDDNAAVFDAAGETIDAIKGKMAAFAAGVLGEVIPAIDDLGNKMAQVDFASFGKKFGEALTSDIDKFRSAILGAGDIVTKLDSKLRDVTNAAIPVDDAFNKAGDSAETLYNAFETARGYTTPLGAAFELLSLYGNKLRESQDSAAVGISNAANAAEGATPKLESISATAGSTTEKIDALGASAQTTGSNLSSAFTITSDFAPKLEEISSSWGGVNDKILGNKNLLSESYNITDSISGKIEEQVAGFGGVNEQLAASNALTKTIDDTYKSHAEKLEQIKIKQDALAQKESERKEALQESLRLDLEIAQAKASGNTELEKTLTNQKEFNAELKKAIDSGMGETEARAFAQQMVNAKNAAGSISVNTTSITSAKAETAEAAKAAQSFATWLDYINGVDPTEPVKSLKERTKEARKEIEAFGNYIGVDLKNLSYPDIIKKLKIDSIATTGSGQLKEIMDYIDEQRGELLGLNPVDESGSKKSVDSIKTKIEESLGGKQTITFDATESILSIKEQLKESIDLALSSSKGSEFLGEIRGFVETIKDLVQKIEPKLPMQALSY